MIFSKFGDMNKPNYIDSITALYIIYIGFTIKNSFFKCIFIINGLSSFLAHNTFIYKNYPKITNLANYVDSVTIFYALLFYFIKKNRFLYFIIIIIIDLCLSFKVYYYLVKKKLFLVYLIPLILDIVFNKKVNNQFILIIIITLLCKYYQEKSILNKNFKLHSLFHIFGSHMFKNIIELI